MSKTDRATNTVALVLFLAGAIACVVAGIAQHHERVAREAPSVIMSVRP